MVMQLSVLTKNNIDSDGPGVYPVMCSSIAGGELGSLKSGYITRITTGAPVPDGATAVCMVEYTKLIKSSEDEKEELLIEILTPVSEGSHIREIGSGTDKGEKILSQNHQISDAGGEIGVLASVGISKVKKI
jgi:gephyrin